MGKLIVLEGIDGSGKSAQYRRLTARFEREGLDYHSIVFPRYDQESSALIRMYLNGDFGSRPDDVNAYASSIFYAVDRYASYMTDWKAYYQSGGVVLSDRYTTSNAVHQGAKLPPEEQPRFFDWLYDLEYVKLGLPRPDLVIFLDRKERRHSRAGHGIPPALPGHRSPRRGALRLARSGLHEGRQGARGGREARGDIPNCPRAALTPGRLGSAL